MKSILTLVYVLSTALVVNNALAQKRETYTVDSKKPDKSKSKHRKYTSTGVASWYGPGFHGRKTASGKKFNQNALTAAHRTLPFGTKLRVHNPKTNKSTVVVINDRGPYHGNRIIDLSKMAAKVIGLNGTGTVKLAQIN